LVKLALVALGGVIGVGGALGSAVVAGNYQTTNSQKDFVRQQRITAYANYLHDLLAFEDTYAEATRVLTSPAGQAPSGSTPAPTVVSDELQVDLEKMKQSKSFVDIVGSDAASEAAAKAIDAYGPVKGELQDQLLARSKNSSVPPPVVPYDKKLTDLQDNGRDPFTRQAKEDLGITAR
jgi:hypothetical protein